MDSITPEIGKKALEETLSNFAATLRKHRTDDDLAARLSQIVGSDNEPAALKAIELELKLRGLMPDDKIRPMSGTLTVVWGESGNKNPI